MARISKMRTTLAASALGTSWPSTRSVGAEAVQSFELDTRFEELLQVLDDIRIADIWPHATDAERRTLLYELVEHVEVHHERIHPHKPIPATGGLSPDPWRFVSEGRHEPPRRA